MRLLSTPPCPRFGASKLNKILKKRLVPTVPEFIAVAREIGVDPGRAFTDRDLVVELEELREAYAQGDEQECGRPFLD